MGNRRITEEVENFNSDNEASSSFGSKHVKIKNADKLEGSNIDRGTNLEMGFHWGTGTAYTLERNTGYQHRHLSIDFGEGDGSMEIVSEWREPGKKDFSRFSVNSDNAYPVSKAVADAMRRSFSDKVLSDLEALQLEKLRQAVTTAAPGGFDQQEVRALQTRAGRISSGAQLD